MFGSVTVYLIIIIYPPAYQLVEILEQGLI